MTSNYCLIPILGRKRYLNVYLEACPAIVVYPKHCEGYRCFPHNVEYK